MLETIRQLLGYLGITSLVALLGLWIAFIKLPPEIVIEAIIDRSKKFNSESKLKVRNIGTLAAHDIKADVLDARFVWNTNTFHNIQMTNGPNVAARLAGNESAEISVTPGIHFAGASNVDSFVYTLVLKYTAKLWFLKKSILKKWKIELRTFPDGFAWDVTIL